MQFLTTMRRRMAPPVVATTLLALSVLAAAACSSSDATAPNSSNGDNAAITAQGRWALRTLNGATIPGATAAVNGTQITVWRDTLEIWGTGSGDYNETIEYSAGPNPYNNDVPLVYTSVEAGTWTASGNTITFTTSDGQRYTGTIAGNTLTENVPGFMQVYSR